MTDNFPVFSNAVHAQYERMAATELFTVDVEDIFASYLAAFPEGTNPIFRTNTEHDCSCCKNFIRNLGKLVAVNEQGTRMTVWDNWADLPEPYATVGRHMQQLVMQAPIVSVYRTKESSYGAQTTVETGETLIRWHHFHGKVHAEHKSPRPDESRGRFNTNAAVFRRGLEELKMEDLETVRDLIIEGNLYRGAEHKSAVDQFIALKREYEAAPDREAFIWGRTNPRKGTSFRNSVIGTLVVDLSAGVDLEDAVRMFESKVAPHNYQRPKALITPKMVEAAVQKLRDLDLESAVERRHARLSDVSVNDVLWVNRDSAAQMKDGIEGVLMGEAVRQTKVDFSGLEKTAETVSMDFFLEKIAPKATKIELALTNKLLGNFMSVTAPAAEDTGRLFSWNNDFAWSYDGDVADSVEQRVKAAGGKTNTPLRVSLAWHNLDDLDIHCQCPDGHIYYGNRENILDVDMNVHRPVRNAVENLSWTNPKNGRYSVTVNNFTRRDSSDVGFVIELAQFGDIRQFVAANSPGARRTVDAISFDYKNGEISNLKLGASMADSGGSYTGAEKWGLTTGQLVPVATLMRSPNHWGKNQNGNLHWFFILEGCKNPDSVRGIYNEFLRAELKEHRKVFEVLGSKAKCPPADDQLSGVGFSSTKKESAIFVVNNRAYKVEF